jgi:transcriptional regulator of acetoin/glycerol metabolism
MGEPRDSATASVEFELQKATTTRAFLFVVLQADRPLTASARQSLEAVEAVSIRRGGVSSVSSAGEGRGSLSLLLPDPAISSTHARVFHRGGGWSIEDAGSKNGTFVNGKRIQASPIRSGDVIQAGHTLLLLREDLPAPGQTAGLVDAAQMVVPAPGLATLLPALSEEFGKLVLVAPTKVPIVLGGESGVGKEVVASVVHRLSGRAGPFQAVNCGAIARTLVESELFGYRKGAFSGADEDRPGLVRSADRGTLFLDEIGDLPLPAQATLLRVLQESEVVPVGGTRPAKVDFRLVAATHRSLEELAAKKEFRADLLARLAGFALSLPPLRERREDLGLLVAALLRRHLADRAGSISFTSDAARALLCYDWPLNVRELEKCLTTAAVLSRGGRIELSHLPSVLGAALHTPRPAPETSAFSAEEQDLRSRLVALLESHGGNVTAVADAMGKARNQIHRWMRRFAIDPERYRR